MTPLQSGQNINVHILQKHIWKFHLNPNNSFTYEQNTGPNTSLHFFRFLDFVFLTSHSVFHIRFSIGL